MHSRLRKGGGAGKQYDTLLGVVVGLTAPTVTSWDTGQCLVSWDRPPPHPLGSVNPRTSAPLAPPSPHPSPLRAQDSAARSRL